MNARRDGVPAVLDQPNTANGDWSVRVYGATWVMRLYPTREFRGTRRGYTMVGVEPLRLRDHHRLAAGCLVVRAPMWQRVFEVRQLPDHADAHWYQLGAEWGVLTREHAVARHAPSELTSGQDAFLATVERVIDANESITKAAVGSERPYPYRAVNPVGERRSGTHAVYEFVLADGKLPSEDAFVRIRGESEQRGQVIRIAGRSVTVRFDLPVAWDRIATTGELEASPSTIVFKKQREAVTLLRDRLSRNPDLLSVLVDNRVRRLEPPLDQATVALDDSQLAAFRAALAVADLMLILGPPGTGKTRVISQIAHATAVGGPLRPPGRVLVTSHTNRAVDNVLGRLPKDLTVVRVGNEGVVTDEGRPYLLETQARELRERILGAIRGALDGMGDLEIADKWAAELDSRTAAFGETIVCDNQARAEFDSTRRAEGGSIQVTIGQLSAAHHRRARKITRTSGSLRRTTGLAARFGVFAGWWRRRLAVLETRLQGLNVAHEATAAELAAMEQRLDEATKDVPAVRAARVRLDTTGYRLAEARAHALTAAHSVRAAMGGSAPPPRVRDTGVPDRTHADLRALLGWLADWLPLLRRRALLLSDWHGEVSAATTQLYPELVRYADVIAATSIGAASRPELSDVDFDLVIVDEAGQIGMADVLVPLVRGRRAVLVGDHQQLPPFLDSEVASWGASIDDPTVRRLLTHSALELLVKRLPSANVVPLTSQRRMPLVIAEFISRTFYHGELHTNVERDYRDPIFRSAFAFVDTAGLPQAKRRERQAGDKEQGQGGYHNPVEARLLAKLAAHYDGLGQEWAVIVPYRAQAKAITTALVGLIGQPDKVRLNIGSVDSFQGGERDVILYGFTRSNLEGRVGFLTELRRANVAFTRAKRQLVLVGDLSTLTTARDDGFRELAVTLRDHIARKGDIRPYDEIDAKLETV
ncbi:MAG: AAA domain-containing protein [Actinomycetota bacterium]|nr:AAA domain-containing protein [Actinomycetota bacterium]